jgi:hypothetical protein
VAQNTDSGPQPQRVTARQSRELSAVSFQLSAISFWSWPSALDLAGSRGTASTESSRPAKKPRISSTDKKTPCFIRVHPCSSVANKGFLSVTRLCARLDSPASGKCFNRRLKHFRADAESQGPETGNG